MQVLIRRKGVSLRAEWDGLAKPSDKQLHYWLRTTPDAPVANADTASPVTDVLVAPLIDSSAIVATTAQTVRSATVVLYKGITGHLERPADAPVLGSTTVTDANAVIVNYAAGPMANAQVIDTQVSGYQLNLLRIVRVSEHTTPKLVNQIKYAGHEVLRFAGHDYASCYQVSDNQMIEVVKYQLNMLNVTVSNAAQQQLPASSVDREDTVLLKAPLPSGELLRANDASYDPAPAATNPDHMELVTQVNDPLAHTHWSRTPKPTHFVQESQTPVGADELVRASAPVFVLNGGRWETPIIYGEGSDHVTNEGSGAVVRPMGTRGVISLTHTNGLSLSRFSQSQTTSSYKYKDYYYKYGQLRYWWATGYRPEAFAYEVFSGAHTDPEAAIMPYTGKWTADGSSGTWVQIDFGKIVHGINGLLVQGDGSSMHMKEIEVQVSDDGNSWRTYTVVTTSSPSGTDTFDFEPFSTRFVRLYNNSNWGHEDTSLKGVEILKRGGGAE